MRSSSRPVKSPIASARSVGRTLMTAAVFAVTSALTGAASVAVITTIGGCASPWHNESADLDEQDSTIALRIKSALIDEPSLAGAAIDVEFADGRARLTGFVETREQRLAAARVATEQQGVKRVVNEIVVK